ncbi:MAG: hypothetical protein RR988_05280 [Clostridia bacterium]
MRRVKETKKSKNVTETNKTNKTKRAVKNKSNFKKPLVIFMTVLIVCLVICLGTLVAKYDDIENYIFNAKLNEYVRLNYAMDLEIQSIKYAPIKEGVNTGDYWNYEFRSVKYPDIKVTGVLQYVKLPEQLKLNIEDIDYANKVKLKLQDKLKGSNVEIKSLKYVDGEYQFTYTENNSESEKKGFSPSKNVEGIILNEESN